MTEETQAQEIQTQETEELAPKPRRKRKSASQGFSERMNDFQFEVLDPVAEEKPAPKVSSLPVARPIGTKPDNSTPRGMRQR